MSAGPRTRLYVLLRPHLGRLVPALGLAVIVAFGRGLLVPAAAAVFEAVDRAAHAGLGQATALLGAGVIVQAAGRALRTWATRTVAISVERRLRSELFEALLRADPAALHRQGRGEAMARLSHDTGRVRQAVGALVTWVQNPITVIVVAAATLRASPGAAPLALLAAIAVAAGGKVVGRWTRVAAGRHLAALGAIESHARDRIAGARAVQAAGAEALVIAEHERLSSSWEAEAMALSHAQALGPPVTEVMLAAALLLVLYVGGRVDGGGAGTIAFLGGLALLAEPVRGLAGAQGLWEEARAALERVDAAITQARPLADAPGALPLPAGPLRIDATAMVVRRSWGPVFPPVDLHLGPGEFLLVEGPSGAGKTTLLDVLGAQLDPDEGTLNINGAPASAWTRTSRAFRSAWVGQDPLVIAGTVADNLRLAAPEAPVETLVDAARRCGLGPCLERIGGIDVAVGDGGHPLSGGEEQRLQLARAVLREAPLWLLDEPTAHLDDDAEQDLLRLIHSLLPGRVVVMASHRPAARAFATQRIALPGAPALPA